MWYPEAKIYHDGSHYVAIPKTTNPTKKRPKPIEEEFEVEDEVIVEKNDGQKAVENTALQPDQEEVNADMVASIDENIVVKTEKKKERKVVKKKVTRSSEFERLYQESKDMPKGKQKRYIVKNLVRLFYSLKETESYVEYKLQNKIRASITRRIRFTRKANMNMFNYFVTFTYDNAKHTEQSFKKKLLKCLQNFRNRLGWKYMGVWERAPKTNRLHFHGLIYIPEGTLPGELKEKKDYNTTTHKMQVTKQNSYFETYFGRNDFEDIDKHPIAYAEALKYILKYIEKTGEKLVYSRGLPMYVISDINEDDVITRTGVEDTKLVLFDNFTCWDEGELIGEMSDATKKLLRTSN